MSDINTINYQPLEADEHPYKLVFRRNTKRTVAVLAGIVVLCVVFVELGIAALVIWLGYVGRQVAAVKNGAWRDFAVANGWQLGTELAPETLLPQSLAFGNNRIYSPVITLQAGPMRSDLFTYKTTVPAGRASQTYSFSVARVTLPAELPHIMLRAKRGTLVEVRGSFTNLEALALEGDFDSYFTLQIEKGQEVNALEIITPDVMQALISYSQREDVEITGTDLYFIMSGDASTPESVSKLIQSAASASAQIIENVKQTAATASKPQAPSSTPNTAQTPAPPVTSG